MKLSARNAFKGKVLKVVWRAMNSEGTLELPGGSQIVSIITNESVLNLKLKINTEAYAEVKASNVVITAD